MQDWHSHYIYDFGLLYSKATGEVLCNMDEEGYLRVRKFGKEYRGHRIIWEMFHSEIPEGMVIDHINGNNGDNRIENLRMVTRQENNSNRIGSKVSGLPKGVTKVGDKYRARIMYKGKTISIGTFKTAEEAGAAYRDFANELQGEFAVHNSRKT